MYSKSFLANLLPGFHISAPGNSRGKLEYLLPPANFIVGLFVVILIFLLVKYHFQVHTHELFALTISLFQMMYIPLQWPRSQLKDVIKEYSSGPLSERIKLVWEFANFATYRTQHVPFSDEVNEEIQHEAPVEQDKPQVTTDHEANLSKKEEVPIKKEIALIETHSDQPSVLLLMEETPFRNYLAKGYAACFKISVLDDPDLAISTCIQQKPDAILLDETIKGVSGDKLCYQIKQNQAITPLPIIMLVKSDKEEDYFSHVKSGADRVEVWTISLNRLQANLYRLIETYHRLRAQQQKPPLPPEAAMIGITITTKKKAVNQKFIAAAEVFIKKHFLEDGKCTVEMLSDDIGMCLTKFRIVMRENTGMAPLEFIRAYRMKRATELLALEDVSISAIADELAFYDVKYFGKQFKKYFHLSPSEYKAMLKEQNKQSVD